jgi:uncharacterized protein YcfL
MGIEAFVKEHSEAYVDADDAPVEDVDEEVAVVEDEEVELKRIKVTSTMRVLIRYHSYCYDMRGKHLKFR